MPAHDQATIQGEETVITLNIPTHLVPLVYRAIEREIEWFNSLTPDAQDLWAGPLTEERSVVLVGVPFELSSASPSESHHSRAVA